MNTVEQRWREEWQARQEVGVTIIPEGAYEALPMPTPPQRTHEEMKADLIAWMREDLRIDGTEY